MEHNTRGGSRVGLFVLMQIIERLKTEQFLFHLDK